MSEAASEAKDKERRDVSLDFTASDIDPKAVKLAERHASRAGVGGKIKFSVRDVGKFSLLQDFGTIVTNPPYGERVYDKDEAEACYKKLASALKGKEGWSLFLITAAKNFERTFGRKCDREKKIFNAGKECRYYFYYGKKR